jgi:hypothetical protein
MAELKTQKNRASALAFINTVPDPVQRQDALTLLKIMKEVTGEKPMMWGEAGMGPRRKAGGASAPRRGRAIRQQANMRDRQMVGFGEYHYKSERSTQEGDWPLTAFSPRKQNLTVYIMPGFKGHEALLKKLGKHKISGGSCLYVKRLSDIHLPTLSKIIEKGYKAMKKRYAV